MSRHPIDNRVFLAFMAAGAVCLGGGLVLGNAISPNMCTSFGATSPIFGMATLIEGVIIAQAWPRAGNVRLVKSLGVRAGTLLLLVLAAAILQPSLYCAVEPGLGFYAAIGGVGALWVAILLFAHLFVGRYAARPRQDSAAGDEEPGA